MENHAYSQVIGTSSAPYINNTLKTGGADLSQSYGLTHPSQPNYFTLFSGSTQGVTDDSCYTRGFSSAPNLASELIAAGQDLGQLQRDAAQPGFDDLQQRRLRAKHNPWFGFSNVPDVARAKTFAQFPTDYTTLPNVSFVTPNLCSDMHDCSVSTGDTWLKNNLGAYATWAKTHNSLLVVTFDEDNQPGRQPHPDGPVRPAGDGGVRSSTTYNHYNMLRTLEDSQGLTHPRGQRRLRLRHHRHLGLPEMYVADSRAGTRCAGVPDSRPAPRRAAPRRGRPHRPRPRHGQPDHRRLLGDGHRRPPAVPGRGPRPVARWASACWTASTTAFGAWSGWPAATSPTAAAAATRWWPGSATACRRCASRCSCSPTASPPSAGPRRRPHRQGPAHRPARRDDLPVRHTARHRGRAFGVHRAMDTAGALLGPLAAFLILRATVDGYDAVFTVSVCVAVLGVLVLVLFVPGTRSTRARRAAEKAVRPTAGQPVRCATPSASCAAASCAVSRCAPLLLGLDDRQRLLRLSAAPARAGRRPTSWFPLLPLGTAAAFLLLAVPLGALADRVGPPARLPRRARGAPDGVRASCSPPGTARPSPTPSCSCTAPSTRRPTACSWRRPRTACLRSCARRAWRWCRPARRWPGSCARSPSARRGRCGATGRPCRRRRRRWRCRAVASP